MVEKPDRKVAGGAVIGLPVSVVFVWVLTAFVGVEVPAEVATAIGSIFTFVASYFVKN